MGTQLSVIMDSDIPVPMETIHLPFLSETTAMALTVHGEHLLTLVHGLEIGLALTVLLLMPMVLEKVSGTLLLTHGLVLSTSQLPTVLMTGPPLVLLPSMSPPFPDGPEII